MERYLKEQKSLLDENGHLIEPGYATSMIYDYDKNKVNAGLFALKEWDFYQFYLDDYILQVTIGHVSYVANFSATIFSLTSGEQYRFSRIKPFPLRKMNMPSTPDEPAIITERGKDYEFSFITHSDSRFVGVKAFDKKIGDIDIELNIASPKENEKMVIATPFKRKNQFYLNCKENFYHVEGKIRFGKKKWTPTASTTAVLDWGRGVWPFRHEWFWGSGSANLAEGQFGFNLGWGFGVLSHATENMFFWNGKAVKLGAMIVDRDPQNYMAPWTFTDTTGKFHMQMTPVYDNFTQTKFGFVNNKCHQVFGEFNGFVILPTGEKIKINNLLAFCEHAVNQW